MIIRSLSLIGHNLFFGFIGIIGLTALIGFHELGHFLFCKLFRIHTPTFSIGFGPQIFSKKIGKTNFALSAIPLGGYVEIAGLAEVGQGEQKEAKRTDHSSFVSKPFWQKLLVLFGGILFNLLFAYAALILLFAIGMPKTQLLYPANATTIISHVHEGTPAHEANLQAGDEIVAINNIELHGSALKFTELVSQKPLESITVTISRDGNLRDVSATLLEQKNGLGQKIGTLGVTFEMISLKSASLIDAFKDGIALTNRFIHGIIHAFKHIFTKADVSSMGGPVQIISAMTHGAGQSFAIFLLILAMISVNLAVLNLIPLPILDGGQILYFTIEAIIRRPIPLKVREYIHIASWLFVLSLVLYLSAQDIYRIFKPSIDTFAKFLLGLCGK